MQSIYLQQKGSCICQVVRSAGGWSYGLRKPESSIQIAYLELIDQAEHFIYIENQFFISSIDGKVQNKIAEKLFQKIQKAVQENKLFYVMIVMPLLPAFEGDPSDSNSALLRVQLHWEYSTICRGENSLLQRINRIPGIIDASDYIGFYGLRKYDLQENGDPSTEIVYVHSKCMIIDDDVAIIGSANINDRSMLGNRDSEIAMVIKDSSQVSIQLAQQYKLVSKFARNLRMQLCQEHLGIEKTDFEYQYLEDPCSADFIQLVQQRSNSNTYIYRHIFRCYPDDELTSSSQKKQFLSQAQLQYHQMCQNIKGNIVQFPLKFLEEDNLNIKLHNFKEYIISEKNFV